MADGRGTDQIVKNHLKGHDVACAGCGYNLRGLEEPRCPECARPVHFWDILPRHNVRPGGMFWMGVLLDGLLLVAIVMGMSAGRDLYSWAVSGSVSGAIWLGVTLVFVAWPLWRRGSIDEKTFVGELTWALWLALVAKAGCLSSLFVGW